MLGRRATRRRALHRLRSQPLAGPLQKQFRRQRNQTVPVIANEPAVANGLSLAQACVESQGRPEPFEFKRKGQINLITVAFENQAFYPVHRGNVGFLINRRPQVADAGTAGTTLRQPERSLPRAKRDPPREAPEPGQRSLARLPARWRRLRLEQIAQFVVEGNDSPLRIVLQSLQHGFQRRPVIDLETVNQPVETPSGGFAIRRPPILEKCGEFRAYLRFR